MERIVYSNPIRWSVVAMLLLSVASMWAQVNGSAAQAAVNAIQKDEQKKPQTELNSVTPNAPVGPGDLLEISLFGTPDFHQETRVTTTGDLALPLIGSIHVTGLTPEAVATAIRKKLIEGDFYKDPQVSVLVKDYVAAGIYVLGEVQRPGFYSILKANTLLQAVALAGGTTVKAGRSVTITNPNRTPREVTANLSDDGDAHVKDPAMMAGDTMVVSKAGIVYVVGDVRLPSGIVMDNENLTVLQAISLAQGLNPNASLDNAKLIRRTAQGPQEQPLPLKKMLAAKAPDIKVQPDDIIFVPKSTFSAFSKRGLEAILQAATGVAMYTRY
jgi:polysaccharide export outer membrane protein